MWYISTNKVLEQVFYYIMYYIICANNKVKIICVLIFVFNYSVLNHETKNYTKRGFIKFYWPTEQTVVCSIMSEQIRNT